MKAALLENGRVHVGESPDPEPKTGQILVRTRRCALCASDAHFVCSGQAVVDLSKKYGGPYATVDLSQPIIMGHEYVGEVIDYGPGSRRPFKVGSRVTSVPVMRAGGMFGIVGYSAGLPGGFGEYMLLDEDFSLQVPDALDDDQAALIEPLAVGLEHAAAGEPKPGEVPLVIGCGAIGLGVIVGLRLAGVGPIVAADFNAARREMALKMGADLTIDPRERSPYEPLQEIGGKQVNLVYECVGKKGMLNEIMTKLPFGGRLVVGGFCLEPEEIAVAVGQSKKLKINFCSGEGPDEMAQAIRAIGEGKVDIDAWIGGRIGLGGVAEALDRMNDPSSPVRTVVDPSKL
jgi:2-desacetyl-2-hydroxyethyl bacteriochlorophyllide A dehydrogenase